MASSSDSKPVTYIICGAGSRGKTYASYAAEFPDRAKVVGVADPRPWHREYIATEHKISAENVVSDWSVLANGPKLADAVVISTPDIVHVEPAIAFAKKGYHILLEKPMAISKTDCERISAAVKEAGVILAVGHVLRYTNYNTKIKNLLKSGIIGDVINIQHLEPVGHFHFAHSYVRGNWRRQDQSTFSLMAKSCHDIDLIRFFMGVPCTAVSSFGSLRHFKPESKPVEAGEASRCLDCKLVDSCAYSAKKIYLDPLVERGHKKWPVDIIVDDVPDVENVTQALKTGPYGRCVYASDNDVVDQQVVNMEFEGGRTATFSMIAFTKEICVRKTKIFGHLGELQCDGHDIIHHNFETGETKVYLPDDTPPSITRMSKHGYGDYYLAKNFFDACAKNDPSLILSGPDETLESHLTVFAAEDSRLQRKVVELSTRPKPIA